MKIKHMTVENLVKPLVIGTKHPTLAYFYKIFKECYSMTPMMFRKQDNILYL